VQAVLIIPAEKLSILIISLIPGKGKAGFNGSARQET
jgi:hypothetical protein